MTRRRKASIADVSFTVSEKDRALIAKIVDRAMPIAKEFGWDRDRIDFVMDLTATHANGNKMRFADLLAADDFNFSHDVFGIARHLDRETGRLLNCFSPRFSA